VWFLKNGGRPRLTLEAGPELFVLPELFGEDFQRDGTALLRIVGPVHLAHATSSEQAGEPVVAEHLADARVRRIHLDLTSSTTQYPSRAGFFA
jgi:hypothetical protein